MTLLRSAVLLVVLGALLWVGQAAAAGGARLGSGCIAHHPNYIEDVFEVSEDWITILPAITHLSDRERRILYLRFFKGLTQSEIAVEIGISQMHVSRLLSQALQTIRAKARM